MFTASDIAPSVRRTNTTVLVLILSVGGLSFAVLQSLVAPALTTIGGAFAASTSSVSWVLTAYLLSASVATPILGRLGDMLGKRRVLIVVLVIAVVGTLVTALAPNLATLIAGRAIQGVAGAVFPLSIGIVRDELPEDRIAPVTGLLSAIFGVGGGVGIVAAGPIVEGFGWRWLFWFPLMLIVLALVGVIIGLPESRVRTPGRLDIVGAILLSVAVVALLLAIDKGTDWGWAATGTISLLVVGIIALVVFVVWELRSADPLIDVRSFRNRGIWSANLVALVFGFVMFGTFILTPTLLQLPTKLGYGFGVSVTGAGFYLLPTVLAMIALGPLAGVMVRGRGPRFPMVLGSVLVCVAFVFLALCHNQLWQIVISGILTGAGIGLAFAAMANAIIQSVPETRTSEAIAVNTILRTIGGAIGTTVIAAILSSSATASGYPAEGSFTIAAVASAVVAVIAIAAAVAVPSRAQALLSRSTNS